MSSQSQSLGLRDEIRLILQRGREVWGLVPRRRKWALFFAAAVMALTSASNTTVSLLLGRLVDAVTAGTHQGLSRDAMYHAAVLYLGLIASAYVLREALNVVRRYLVESTCTRINRDM